MAGDVSSGQILSLVGPQLLCSLGWPSYGNSGWIGVVARVNTGDRDRMNIHLVLSVRLGSSLTRPSPALLLYLYDLRSKALPSQWNLGTEISGVSPFMEESPIAVHVQMEIHSYGADSTPSIYSFPASHPDRCIGGLMHRKN